jgi:hypothetical protein
MAQSSNTFFEDVIVRRARGRAAVAEGATVEGIGSPLTKAQRRALAAQRRASGRLTSGVAWKVGVAVAAKGIEPIDPTLLAVAKAEAKVRRAQVSLLTTVAAAQAALDI